MATDFRRKTSLPAITERIVETYEQCGAIHHLGHAPLPSYAEVVAIIKDFHEILYPGYGRRQNLHMGNVAYHVGDLIDSLHDRLSQQIERALDYERCTRPDRGNGTPGESEETAQGFAIRLLERIPALRTTLAEDVDAAYDGDPAARNRGEIIFCYPGLAAVTVFRLAHELHVMGVPLLPRMMTEYAHAKTGIDIHPGATIGSRFFIDHGTGVVIGETTSIGNNVKLYQGVTLGALSFPKDENGELLRSVKRHPTIESDVVIYANATILGGRTVIGHHSVIGSSAWITRPVEPYTTVVIEDPRLKYRSPEGPVDGTAFILDYQI